MFCGKCDTTLTECLCPDFEDRINSLKGSPFLAIDFDAILERNAEFRAERIQSLMRCIDISRTDISPAHKLSFDLVPATCARLGEVMSQLQSEVETEYGIKQEDAIALDIIIHRAIARIKEQATEPLRRALIYTAQQLMQKEEP